MRKSARQGGTTRRSREPAELDEFRRYLNEENLASAKGWEWEPLP